MFAARGKFGKELLSARIQIKSAEGETAQEHYSDFCVWERGFSSVAVLQSISAVRQAKTSNKKGHKCIYVFISVRLCVRSSAYLKEKPRGI